MVRACLGNGLKRRIVTGLVAILFLTGFAFRQTTSATEAQSRHSDSNLFCNLKDNVYYLSARPQSYILLGLLVATPALSEHETNRPYRSWTTDPNKERFFSAGYTLGSPPVHLAGALALYFSGKAFHKEEFAGLGSELTSALLISGGIAMGLKLATDRTRPDSSRYSFPSGHATMAFTTAGIVVERYGLWPGIAAEIAATYVGLSRLQENKHYITDVVAGAVLGSYVAYEVSHRRKLANSITVSVAPMNSGAGVELAIHFK
ncbi:MAG: phosphatase PAP2 family protein [Candidatus Zixiibacteriota bacterium]